MDLGRPVCQPESIQQLYEIDYFSGPRDRKTHDAQASIKIASFGAKTAKAAEEAGLRLDITAPQPQAPSMTMALENYIKDYNKSNGKS